MISIHVRFELTADLRNYQYLCQLANTSTSRPNSSQESHILASISEILFRSGNIDSLLEI